MMLLTLVENAIKHGIEPSLRGGEVCVTALQDGQALRLDVQDSGVGLSDSPGHGDGLDNIRSRLKLAYGEAGVLSLHDAPEGGAVASITLPLPSKDPA
jgi:LytS/YehU family sensor histidine kinase